MKLGVLSDVHGNRHALEAVLADGHALGVERWWALGDLVAIGPDPVGVLELLGALDDVEVISGNTERYTLSGDRPPPSFDDVLDDPSLLDLFRTVDRSFAWTHGAVSASGWLSWVADLPAHVRVELPDGTRVLGVHGSPVRDDGPGITPHREPDDLLDELGGCEADIVIGGHTHQVTDRVVGVIRALNGGSVSNPITDDLRPSYLVIDADSAGHEVIHRRVDFDRAGFLGAIAASGHPASDYIASFQHGQQVKYPAFQP